MGTLRIPLVDFADYRAGGARRVEFVKTLGLGLESLGFVNVVGHGTPDDLLDRAYGAARDLFALPTVDKAQFEDPSIGRQRGYTGFGVEKAKDRSVGDLKEFWQVGPDLAADHPSTVSGEIPTNRFPTHPPHVAPVLRELFRTQRAFAEELLVAIGEFLGYDEGYCRGMIRDGNSVLRVIHYPDVEGAVPGAVRAAEHEDINLLTVLPVSTKPGLELLTREGEWVGVETPPGVMVCDTGDMMQLLTGGRMPATTHRVVNPDGADGGRMSMPFFLHPRPDFVLTRRPGGDVTARSFLAERLRENGVM